MAISQSLRSLLFSVIFILICCSCSSNKGTPIAPGSVDNQPGYNRLSTGQSGSPEDNLFLDPRFKGYITTDVPKDWNFKWAKPPDWAVTYFDDIKFDRDLHGWCLDPHRKLNPLTFTLFIDDEVELYKELTYKVEVLPDGGFLYHWECTPYEKYLDYKRHLVEIRFIMFDGKARGTFGYPFLKPLELPSIGTLYYPWRDIKLPVEEQIFDPMKILVFLEGDMYPEWLELIKPTE
jgi:hypothetical protein